MSQQISILLAFVQIFISSFYKTALPRKYLRVYGANSILRIPISFMCHTQTNFNRKDYFTTKMSKKIRY